VWGILRVLSIAKPFVLAASLASIGIGVHLSVKSWLHTQITAAEKRGRAECREAQLQQELVELEAEKNAEIEALKADANRQAKVFAKMKNEVSWARDHVAKQQAAIRRLRKEADTDLAKCLDVRVDTDVLR